MTYARRSTVSSPWKSARVPAKHCHPPCVFQHVPVTLVLLLLPMLTVLVHTDAQAAVNFTNGTSGPITVLPDYSAEYVVYCETTNVLWSEARTACAAKGDGWALATVPSATAQATIASFQAGRMFLAGSDFAVPDRWVWVEGRLGKQGVPFYEGLANWTASACYRPPCAAPAGQYQHFPTYQPDNGLNYTYNLETVLEMFDSGKPGREWNDLPPTTARACYACERSFCTMALDCNTSNTQSVNTSKYVSVKDHASGSGGHCGCVCKDGFTGARCDDVVPTVAVVLPPSSFSPSGGAAYSSEYRTDCSAQPLSWANARLACQAQGRGWDIATVPTASAQQVLGNIIRDRTWLGGSDSVAEGTWVWRGGRLSGYTFYKGAFSGATCVTAPCACESGLFCDFAATEPNNALGAVEEDYVVAVAAANSSTSAAWNDGPHDDRSVFCYACERSFCSLSADCNVTNTLSVNTSKYFVAGEACGCVCKEGFGGPRCDSAVTSMTVNGAYVSQFMGECASQPVSWTDAASRCSSRGDGWALATVNSAAVQAAVAGLTPGMATWIGGNDLATNDVYVWQYGRLKGQTFYTGRKVSSVCSLGPCASPAGMYNNFGVPQPDDGGGSESYVVMSGGSKTWNDAPLFYGTTHCYICERSPCTLALDCKATNTLSVNTSAFYTPGLPCGCVCKEGFSGPHCDDIAPLLDVSGLYLSQFMAECQSRPVSWGDAATACAAKGTGWALATVASPSAQSTIGALCTEAMWVGASDASTPSVWQWEFGRLKGTVFYQGARNSSTTACQTPPCACEAGAYCHWPATNPSNTNNAEQFMEMSSTTTSATRAWNDVPALNSYTRCYACERSLCSQVAALALHSPQQLVQQAVAAFDGFYPNCTNGTGIPNFTNCTALGNCSGNTTTFSATPSRNVPMTATTTANSTAASTSPASPTATRTDTASTTHTAGGSRSSHSHTRSSIQTVSQVCRPVTPTPTATATVIVTAPQPPPTPLPLPLTPVAAASQTVVAAVGSVGVVSTVAVIVSSSGAIARIAQCLDDDDDALSPLVHPLRFAAGAADDPLRFLRAAVIGNALLIPAWAAVSFGFLLPFGLLLAVERRRRRAFSALRAQLRHRPDITRITDLDEHEGPALSVRMLVKVVVRPGSALSPTTAAAGGVSAPHWAHGSLRELRAEMGWPSVLVLPLVAMAEGTGLFVAADDGAAAVIPALLGVAVLVLAVAWWVRALRVVVPSADMLLEPASPIGLAIERLRRRLWPRRWRRAADGGNTATAAPPAAEEQSWWWALLTPAFEFRVRSDNRTPLLQVTLLSIDSGDGTAATAPPPVPAPPKAPPPPVAGQSDFFRRRTEREARHDHIIGGKALRGAELGGFLCALGVGVAEGLPATSAAWCEARVTVAFVLFVLQGLLGMTTTMPFENVAIGALSMVSFVGATAALMNVYGGASTDRGLLQRIATIVGALGVVAIIAGLVRPVTIARRMLRVADARIAQEVAVAAAAIAAPATTPVIPAPPAATLPAQEQLALSLTSTDSDDFDMAPTAPPRAVILSTHPAVPDPATAATAIGMDQRGDRNDTSRSRPTGPCPSQSRRIRGLSVNGRVISEAPF